LEVEGDYRVAQRQGQTTELGGGPRWRRLPSRAA